MSDDVQGKTRSRITALLATIAAIASVSWAVNQYLNVRSVERPRQLARGPKPANLLATEDGRQLLWARGPRDATDGEWFDITGSPLRAEGYQYGIGKDSIRAIDQPIFVAIDDREKLTAHGISDQSIVIGYADRGVAKAYPINILNRCELVNDEVGGKPVTVGW